MIGQLLCRACASPDQFISLGRVPEEKTAVGKVTITAYAFEFKIPTTLRDVVGRDARGLFRLSCGHLHPGPMVSNQEYIVMEDGSVIHGHSLIGEIR
jgi:hypothetical protein